ncbi:hypothetical protein C0J52_13365 [Blattella germanica]|nr:hypothetical protein C0J52_13365 [Blattella germanica]
MAAIQTQLHFNVRKKRSITSKENAEKENVRVLRSLRSNQDEKYLKKSVELLEDSSDSDSDLECLAVKRNVRKIHNTKGNQRVRRLKLSESDDESGGEEHSLSPPKRGKTNDEDTAVKSETSTVVSPNTPSQLISRLHLATPTNTSTAKVDTNEKHFSPKQLFSSGSSYQEVRRALQNSVQSSLPGREEQLNKLHSFLEDHLSAGSSGTLYISGPPGTGKTASLSKLMNIPEFKNGYKIVNVNCTSMKSSGSIYARITEELSLKISKRTEKECLSAIERHLVSNHKMILLVLDEIDQLDSRKQTVLYTIFEWPSIPNSKLVLIGIANALDLTDRILPRLQARLDLKPSLLHFPPYTKMQIVDILVERIKQTEVSDMFPHAALHLLAGKVASTCGDVRRALDIARRVIEIAEAQRPSAPLPLQPTTDHASNRTSPRKSPRKNQDVTVMDMKENLKSPRKSPRKNPNVSTVSMTDVMTVLNSVYGISQSLSTDCDESFPLQQKVLVATLLLMIKKGRSKDVTLGKLHEVYKRVCNKKNLMAVDQAEFLSLCQLVETRGILRVQGKKEARLSKVCLQWDEEEVSSALKDKQLLASIVNDTSYLS